MAPQRLGSPRPRAPGGSEWGDESAAARGSEVGAEFEPTAMPPVAVVG